MRMYLRWQLTHLIPFLAAALLVATRPAEAEAEAEAEAVVAAVCEAVKEAEDEAEDDVGGGTGCQGPQLHGTGIFERVHFNIPPGMSLQGGTFMKKGQPPTPVNDAFFLYESVDGTSYQFKVTPENGKHKNVYNQEFNNSARDYNVTWKPSYSNEWRPLCNGRPALVTMGEWHQDGSYSPSNKFSFSCVPHKSATGVFLEGGAIAKCIDWGFPPWTDRDTHLACARMVMADYCGQDLSHTIEGTPIFFLDPKALGQGPVPPDVDKGRYSFEAAWTVVPVPKEQKLCNEGTERRRWQAKALCLTKQRWATLPLKGRCPLSVPDPRVDGFDSTRPVQFCEDMNQDDLKKRAKLFSYSRFLDKGLYRFKFDGGASLTTTQVRMERGGSATTGVKLDIADFDAGKVLDVAYEGTLFTSQNVPWALLDVHSGGQGLVPLRLCKEGGGYYTDTTCKGGQSTLQGYMFGGEIPKTSAMQPVMDGNALYLGQSGGKSMTTTSKHALDKGSDKFLGYIPDLVP